MDVTEKFSISKSSYKANSVPVSHRTKLIDGGKESKSNRQAAVDESLPGKLCPSQPYKA